MPILPVITGLENPLLRAVSSPVKKIDKSVKKLLTHMLDTVIQCNGLGIAAPQVGINLRIYIARLNFNTKNEIWISMINPEFLKITSHIDEYEEGCLSIPGKFGIIERSTKVTVQYTDVRNKKHTLHLEGLNARIMQHEMDHLNGILIADKMIRETERNKQ